MATSDKFNLKQSCDQWKASLSATGELSQESLKELESHLLDDVDRLSKTDLSVEESFIVAKHRIGSTETISSAYSNHKAFSFHHMSRIVQAIVYFIMFRWLSLAAISIANNLFSELNSQNEFLYLTISLLFQIGALSIVFLTYKLVSASIRKRKTYVRSNNIALIALVSSLLLYILSMRFYSITAASIFPLIQSLFSLVIPFTLFVVVAVINFKEWQKEKRLVLK